MDNIHDLAGQFSELDMIESEKPIVWLNEKADEMSWKIIKSYIGIQMFFCVNLADNASDFA